MDGSARLGICPTTKKIWVGCFFIHGNTTAMLHSKRLLLPCKDMKRLKIALVQRLIRQAENASRLEDDTR